MVNSGSQAASLTVSELVSLTMSEVATICLRDLNKTIYWYDLFRLISKDYENIVLIR